MFRCVWCRDIVAPDFPGVAASVDHPLAGGHEDEQEYGREVPLLGTRLPCHTSEIYYTLPQLHGRHNGIRLQTFSREVM